MLERRFLALLRRHRIAAPRCQAIIGAYTVDFLWPQQWLVAETDGFEHHSSRRGFAADRRRDTELRLAGYTVARFTWRQVTEEPRYVADALKALLRPSSVAKLSPGDRNATDGEPNAEA